MKHIVKIYVGRSEKAAEIVTALGYQSRFRHGFSGGYVVSVDRDDAPAFISLLKEEAIHCRYLNRTI